MIKTSAYQYKRLDELALAITSDSRVNGATPRDGGPSGHQLPGCTQLVSGDSSQVTASPNPTQQQPADACLVCMESPQDAVLLLDCGHSGLCVACASRLWERDRRCPLCREGIAGIMRIAEQDEGAAECKVRRAPAAPRSRRGPHKPAQQARRGLRQQMHFRTRVRFRTRVAPPPPSST